MYLLQTYFNCVFWAVRKKRDKHNCWWHTIKKIPPFPNCKFHLESVQLIWCICCLPVNIDHWQRSIRWLTATHFTVKPKVVDKCCWTVKANKNEKRFCWTVQSKVNSENSSKAQFANSLLNVQTGKSLGASIRLCVYEGNTENWQKEKARRMAVHKNIWVLKFAIEKSLFLFDLLKVFVIIMQPPSPANPLNAPERVQWKNWWAN